MACPLGPAGADRSGDFDSYRGAGIRARAAALESVRNTRIQATPSHRPTAVPTTPGSAMSESVCVARTSRIVLEATVSVASRAPLPAQPASRQASRSVVTVSLTMVCSP